MLTSFEVKRGRWVYEGGGLKLKSKKSSGGTYVSRHAMEAIEGPLGVLRHCLGAIWVTAADLRSSN